MWQLVVGVTLGLLICWLALLVVIWRAKPSELSIADVARLLPELLMLIGRLARDGSLPRRVRWYLWLLLGYLALPIDVIPDFIPVIGYLDDALVVALVVRAVVKASGGSAVRAQWTGSHEGFDAVMRLCRLSPTA